MFVAWRDLLFAKGRFTLIVSVVTLITFLVGFLSGLTSGLADQSISAVRGFKADGVVLSVADDASPATFGASELTEKQVKSWSSMKGVKSAEAVGILQVKAEGTKSSSVALFGLNNFSETDKLTMHVSARAAEELEVSPGDTVTVGSSTYRVVKITGEAWYSHTPTVTVSIADWRDQAKAMGNDSFATALFLKGKPSGQISETSYLPGLDQLTAIGSFKSEVGSLLMIVGMLFGVSALVVGAFFTVWTIQRAGDIAVLKALGGSTKMLLLDAIGQALVVLIMGVGLGMLLTISLGFLVGDTLPFVISPVTTILPAIAMVLLGILGAAAALRSVINTDPLTALGGNR